MNTAFDTMGRWFALPACGDAELREKSKIVHVTTLAVFFALFIPTLTRPMTELARPIFWALSLQQAIMAVAFWLNRSGRFDAAVILVVFGFLGMTGFIVIASDDGFHDIALLIFPSVLVVAGILFDRKLFILLTLCAVALFAGLASMELNGIVRTSMSVYTTIHDLADGILIILATALAVGLLTKNLQDSLARVRSSEAALARSNDDLKRQSLLLRESEARYRLVVESAQDPIVSTDVGGRFRFVNAAAARLSGYAIEDLLGMSFFDFCLVDERDRARRAFFRQVTDRAPNRYYELALRTRSGQIVWLSMNVSLEMWEGTLAGFHVVARDITARRAAEDEVRRLNQDLEDRVRQRTAELESAVNELQNISYTVSHDLRAPLRHISAYAEMTQSRPSVREDEFATRHLHTISFSARWMGMLVDGLIDYLSIGQTELHPVEVDLGDIVHGVIRDVAPETAGRFVRWRVEPLPTVTGDRRLLRQAISNILSNAVKFTQSRQESVIEIGTAPVEGSVPEHVVFIRDNGIGFDPEYQGRLFGLFQRLHSRAEHAGTGIGLANVRRIIHRHEGRVWAEGAVDRGATIYLALPVRTPHVSDGDRPSTSNQSNEKDRSENQ